MVTTSLTEITNAAVALHRQNFGRGPGAAKSYMTDDLLVCVLSDVFTPLEQNLIADGQGDRVRTTRALHHQAIEVAYRARMEAALGREVTTFLSSVDIEADLAVDVLLLGGPAKEPAPGAES